MYNWTWKYVDTIGQILVDFVSRSDVPRHELSGRGVKLAAIIYYDKYLDGEEVVVLPTVADDAREIQELLEEKFKYQLLSEDPNPNVLQSCQEKQLQNERNMVKTFELRLKKWKNGCRHWHNCGHLPDLLPWPWHRGAEEPLLADMQVDGDSS
mgnify:CR=1 FL=1